MYMRITTMSYDPDREGEFMAIADAARDEMKGIEGLQGIRGIRVADGKLIIGAAYDTEASANAAMPKIQGILGKLAAVLNAPPEIQEGPIIWELKSSACGIPPNSKAPPKRGFFCIDANAIYPFKSRRFGGEIGLGAS